MKLSFVILTAIMCLALFGGCALLGQYDRTYSLNYTDAEGRNVGGSIRLAPSRGFKK